MCEGEEAAAPSDRTAWCPIEQVMTVASGQPSAFEKPLLALIGGTRLVGALAAWVQAQDE